MALDSTNQIRPITMDEFPALAATTPTGYAQVWRLLIDMDLVRDVRWDRAATDEPLANLVDNPPAQVW